MSSPGPTDFVHASPDTEAHKGDFWHTMRAGLIAALAAAAVNLFFRAVGVIPNSSWAVLARTLGFATFLFLMSMLQPQGRVRGTKRVVIALALTAIFSFLYYLVSIS